MTVTGVSPRSGVVDWKLDLCGMEKRCGEKVKIATIDGSLEFLCEGDSETGGCGVTGGPCFFLVCPELGNEAACGTLLGVIHWRGRS